MRPLGRLIPLEDAKSLINRNIPQISRKGNIQLRQALGRVLSSDIVSSVDVPPFSRSSMDGYAVLAEDTFPASKFQPVVLELEGQVHAGEVPEKKVTRGGCVEIATGAMLPSGADAVVMVENTEISDGKVQIFKPVYAGSNTFRRGEDIERGSIVIKEGDYLSPAKVGVLAALGLEKVEVFDRPHVAVIPTGDEVAEVGSILKEGQVFDINSHTLASVLSQNGCEPSLYPIVRDEVDSLREVLGEASAADMIVLSGGSSAGERDVLESVLREVGEVIFHGVQIKPGKPTLFGTVAGKPLFGMPGYPTACLTNGYIFLRPAVRIMARLPPFQVMRVQARLGTEYAGEMGRHQFLTVRLHDGKAFPAFRESGAITSIAHADGWIEIPPNVGLIEKGTAVEVQLF